MPLRFVLVVCWMMSVQILQTQTQTRGILDANWLHEFDFHSFVLSEASLIPQLAKKILKVHGAQLAADLEARNRQTICTKVEVTRKVFFEASPEIYAS